MSVSGRAAGGSGTLKQQVGSLLQRQGAGRVQPNSAAAGGYVVEDPGDGSMVVRCDVGALSNSSWIIDSCLQTCREILSEAGLEVEYQEDRRGVFVRVAPSGPPTNA